MKKSLLLSFIFVCAFVLQTFAQSRTVTGRVTSAVDGSPMPGVTVLVKGTTTGTSTDIDGAYSINVPSGGTTLEFRAIGYQNVERLIGNQTTIDVNLGVDSRTLGEVVVVGYGTQSKELVTSAISSVQGEEIRNLPVANIGEALQGRVAGVQINSSSGRPGAPMAVNIRGRSSIQAGNDPLYVVDGVILPSNNSITPNNVGVANPSGVGISALSNINPEDIESIDVLKDAAAAAIYGSRGSNGVVIITTKSGSRGGKSTVNLSTFTGFQSLTRTKDLLNASEYRQMYNEARVNAGGAAVFTQDEINNPTNNVNWLDEILNKNSRINSTQVSITSGGNQKTQFYTSLNYLNQEGPLKRGEFKRYAIRTNVTHDVTDRIKIGSNLAISKTFREETPVDNSIYSPFPRALVARPDQPVLNADGTFAVNSYNNPSHMFQVDNFINLANVFNSTFAEVSILPGLRFRSAVGLDYTYTDQRTYDPITSLSGRGSQGSASAGYVQTQNILTTQTLSYGKDFLDNRLFVDGTAVYEYQWNDRENNRVNGVNFPSDGTPYVTSAASITGGTASIAQFRMESMLARVNMALDKKYLLGASIRRDGSSKLPEDGRYGYFPSVSAGWVLSEEAFLSDNNVINFLKLRSSFGETGNLEGIGPYSWRRLIGSGFNYNDSPGLGLSAIGSPNLKWETTRQFDVGLEFSILNNRIDFSADYYRKNTNDILINRPIPETTGFNTILENVGSMKGSGFDFMLTTRNFTGDFNWTTTVNLSTYKNEVTELFEDTPINGAFATRTAVGQPLGSFYLIKSLGVDPATGDMRYEDVDGNGTIADADRQFLGSPLPKHFGGINNNFAYKGFDLGIFFQYSYGNMLYNMNAEGIGGSASLGAAASATAPPTNIFREVYEGRWTEDNTDAKYPRAIGGTRGNENARRSSRYLEDGSYLRLKNITLGYNIPSSIASRAKLSNVRIYVTGQNILTFTNYTGLDPEVSSEYGVDNLGVDQGSIPQMKTVTFGVNIGI